MALIAKACSAIAGVFLLSSCGPMNEGGFGSQFAKDKLGALMGTAETAAPAAAPSPSAIAANPGDILLVTIMSRNAVAPLTKIAQNGGTVTWISPGKVSLTLKDDIVIATRGLNEDLMGATVTGVRAALAAGGGTARRTHSYLDSEDQVILRDVDCTIVETGPETIAAATGTREAIKYTESCTSNAAIFTNSYWLDQRGGNVVQSRQAIAPTTGFLQINPL